MTTEAILAQIEKSGLLLAQDKQLPSVVGYVIEEPLSGSWWAHPSAHQIFNLLGEISAHQAILSTRLVAGKITFVYRRLWPAVLAVALSDEPWQRDRLSTEAATLLARVRELGELRATGSPARELSRRLLVRDYQVHAESGHHELVLETWASWAIRVGCKSDLSPAEGRKMLESAVAGVGGSSSLLPWNR